MFNNHEINVNYNNIKEKIEQVVNRCIEDDVYSSIMADYFDKGIVKNSLCLENLEILPHLNEKELKKNFEENIKKYYIV